LKVTAPRDHWPGLIFQPSIGIVFEECPERKREDVSF
jgi:hypothetical protein